MAFDPPVDIGALPPAVQRILAVGAPLPVVTMAAKGVTPGIRPEHIVTVVALLSRGGLAHVPPQAVEMAEGTLQKLPAPILRAALAAPDLPAGVIDLLATLYGESFDLLEKLLTHPQVGVATVERLARAGTEQVTELIAVNEERLLNFPRLIEALYMNKRTRMSTADRLLDLAVRNGKELNIPAFREAAAAIVEELISEPSTTHTPDDLLFLEAQREAEKIDDAIAGDVDQLVVPAEEGEEEELIQKRGLPLDQRLRLMTVSQRIRTAMLGGPSARALLVRDKNRLVASAVIRSPLIQENEAANYAGSRAVSEDVLRLIGMNGDFMKSHVIKYNLVGNPKCPLAISARILPHLRSDELKRIAKSKNVPAQIAKLARQELSKRKPGG